MPQVFRGFRSQVKPKTLSSLVVYYRLAKRLHDIFSGSRRKPSRIGERDRPGRRGARLPPRFFAGSCPRILLRMGRVQTEGRPVYVWRDAKHCARDARAPRNCRCPIRSTGNVEKPLFRRVSQIRKRVLRELPQHPCRHSAFKLAFAKCGTGMAAMSSHWLDATPNQGNGDQDSRMVACRDCLNCSTSFSWAALTSASVRVRSGWR